jgi:hypothetical protein
MLKDVVRLLLRFNADPNRADEGYFSPPLVDIVSQRVSEPSAEIVELLLEHAADVNVRDQVWIRHCAGIGPGCLILAT